jgi:integrase
MRLTEREIDRLACPPGSRDKLVFDDVQKGLAVRVTVTGSKTYLAQYTISGQKRRVPLGACSAISLTKAREACVGIMGNRAHGIDTAAERKVQAAADRAAAERERLTLAALVDSWQQLHLTQRRARYTREAVRALRHAFPRQWDRPAEELGRPAVVRVLDAIAKSGRTSIASRTAAYGRACFQWGLKRGTVAANPFSALPAIGEKPKRDRVLSDDELSAVWRAASVMPLPFGGIVRLLILTGQRREEVAGIAWAELSDDFSIWTIAANRTKNGVPHVVPLAEPARALLRALPRAGDLVMPGDRPPSPFSGWSKAKTRLDTTSGIADWVLHDLRRTMATGLQRLGVRLEVTEAVLNHISGSRAGIVGIYQRHDWAAEKRAALDAWAKHVMGAVEGRDPAANVVSLAGR